MTVRVEFKNIEIEQKKYPESSKVIYDGMRRSWIPLF